MKTKRIKILEISVCNKCHFCNFDDNTVQEKWGKYWCEHPKVKAELPNKGGRIPKFCPLPDKSDMTDTKQESV